MIGKQITSILTLYDMGAENYDNCDVDKTGTLSLHRIAGKTSTYSS